VRKSTRRLAAVLAAAGLALAGCGDDTGPDAGSGGGGTGGGLSGTVTVFAAASLTESFGTLGKRFEAAHPGVTMRFNFAASSALAESIAQGAPADVFASASAKNMDSVVRAGDAADPKTFAKNVMAIAVPPANPAGVAELADLAKPGLKLALCQEQVPCGTVAEQVFDKAKLSVTPVTLGADVKSVLTAVQLGEVDAGMVYRTDVLAAGSKVKGIEIPAELNASTSYPITTLTEAPNAAAARAFVDYVLSADGAKVLTGAGFAGP
jgi:molybdate transport system substrate-binding protein